MKNCISHKEETIESFVRDPEFAEVYLKEVLSDGDMAEVHQARPWVEEARSRRQDAIMA